MLVSSAVRADDKDVSGAKDGGWEFEVMPYLWAAGMKGEVGIGQLSEQGVDASFNDIAKYLSAGFMGTFEGHKDRFGFLFDAIYMKLTETTTVPFGSMRDVNAAVTQQGYTFAGTWRFVEGEAPVELVGGVRTNYIKLDLSLAPGALAPQGRRAVGSKDWVDGFVGIRGEYPFASKWAAIGYVDLGAGGSKFTWQGKAAIKYGIS